jgi:hypothetical protein
MKRIQHFTKTIDVINSDLPDHEKIEILKDMNMEHEDKSSKFQKILDFLAQPVYEGKATPQDAHAHSILVNGYWEAVSNRNRREKIIEPDKHLHIHLSPEDNPERIEKMLRGFKREQIR